MLAEENEAISRVGSGTLMGDFMREYWLPAMLSTELPHPDSDPLRVVMLGEQLVGFRDSLGRPGLLANLCPHRGASLFFGRNEDCGLRCVYHGWKFDVSGRCIDMPNEPPESNFKERVRARSYPCAERGGFIWVYMGSRDVPPPLPDIEATLLPEGEFEAAATMRSSNWLQVLEGDIDTVHAAFLHGGHLEPEWYPEDSFPYYELKQRVPRYKSVDTEYGAMYGAYRVAWDGMSYWRIGGFLLPCWTNPAGGVLGAKIFAKCIVPMDDTHCMVFEVGAVDPDGGMNNPGAFGHLGRREAAPNPELLPNSTDWFGRFRTAYELANDFLVDRAEQRSLSSFTGMPFGAGPEDAAMTTSMGGVADRTVEHLGGSDQMITRVRNRLLTAAMAFADDHSAPPAVDDPSVYSVRHGGILIPDAADWIEYTEPLRVPFVTHPELDLSVLAGRIKGRAHQRSGPLFS